MRICFSFGRFAQECRQVRTQLGSGMPVFADTTGNFLSSIFRAPDSHRVTVTRETSSMSANCSCDSGGVWFSRNVLSGWLIFIAISVPFRYRMVNSVVLSRYGTRDRV